MGPPIGQRRARRLSIRGLETWLWTGPIGHLVGGALDFGYALARYLLARVRSRAVR
ncbi:MAG TPA: hypothetical protein VMG80_03150 [Solirubrobacteraceae bacterium]|nr:hypothetical protein [Solirubrobacteraceae bacterium]